MSAKSELLKARKALVAGLGAVALLVSAGVLSGTAEAVAETVLALATTLGVYGVKNAS